MVAMVIEMRLQSDAAKLCSQLTLIVSFLGYKDKGNNKNLKHRQKFSLIAAIFALMVTACTPTSETKTSQTTPTATETTLNIWWDKGYVLEEDEIIQQVISNWEQASGKQAKLTLYTADEIAQKAKRSIKAGTPPDVMFSSRAEYPLLAWEGQLADVADVIEPVKEIYAPAALQAAYLYNNQAKKRSYYAVPLHQATIHIFYWQDLLQQAGKSASEIPPDWDGFWQFWLQAGKKLPSSQPETYALGFPFSVEASDTYYLFEQILEAYDVEIINSQGELQIEQPQIRQGIIKALNWYAQFYQQGYVPPTATRWLDPDNNRNLLNRFVLMSPNPTLSIPVALRQEPNTYQNQLGIIDFPNKPSGKPMRYLIAVRQAVVFAAANNQQAAKDFLRHLIQPQVLGEYLKSAGGRYLPATIPARQDPFWTNPQDPHISTATRILIDGETRPFYTVQNPAYSAVLESNVWGKVLHKMAVKGISGEQAADEAIEEIKQIFDQW